MGQEDIKTPWEKLLPCDRIFGTMIQSNHDDGHEFMDDLEEASLLGFSSGSIKLIHSFEIEQARQIRRKSNRLFSWCTWSRVVLILSGACNVGLTIVVVQSPEALKNERFHAPNHSTVIYGHVHMTQTAGTDRNGLLAAQYDHVCGSRGYSLDYYQYNERLRNSTSNDPSVTTDVTSIFEASNDDTTNRGRVPWATMQDIGFEDCDWISLEQPWHVWPDLLQILGSKWKLELHVPCRDPLDHLLSMCHNQGHEFDCHGGDLESEIEMCIMAMDRFSLEWEFHSKIRLVCFPWIPLDAYVSYMSHRLQSKRMPAEYVLRGSSELEDQEEDNTTQQDCLKQSPHIAYQVRQLLLENYEYYRWCNDCLGSDH